MQRIKNLEQWQTKAKEYNPRINNGWIWAMMIAIMLMLFATPFIYAEGPCWESITCPQQKDAKIDTDGHSEYCEISRISTEGSSNGQVIIEIISPNLYGADAYHWFVINEASPYFEEAYPFLVGGMSSPVYVLCSDYITPTYGDYTSGKGYLINRWSTADSETKILINGIMSGEWGIAVDDTNVTKSYENLSADSSNPFIMGLGYLLLAFGIFLSFTFVFQLFKRR